MHLEVELLRDKSGNPYFGIEIPEPMVQPDLDNLARLTTEQQLRALVESRELRDGAGHHLTVVRPGEIRSGVWPSGSIAEDALTFLGLGTVLTDKTQTYYSVVESDELVSMRHGWGIGQEYHPHVTIGFFPKDIHDQPKGPATVIAPRAAG